MLIINCTKAAAEFFSTTKNGKKLSPIEPAPEQTIAESNDPHQWQWVVHAIKVKGKNVLVAMDYQTRFSITLSALKKGDVAAFLDNLEHHLTVHVHNLMTDDDSDDQGVDASIDRYLERHNDFAFYQRSDRSTQSYINDITWHFRRRVEVTGEVPTKVDLIGFDEFINARLRKRKDEIGYFNPQEELLYTWQKNFGEPTTRLGLMGDHAALNNIVVLDDYRKK